MANPIAGQFAGAMGLLKPKLPKPITTNPLADDEALRTKAAQEAFLKRKQLRGNSLLSRAGAGAGDTEPAVLTGGQATADLDLGS